MMMTLVTYDYDWGEIESESLDERGLNCRPQKI